MTEKRIRWNELKSKRLKRTRGVSFEEILQARLIGIGENQARPGQRVILYEHQNYIWVVPCVETENEIFLKTLYPSRRYTKIYKEGRRSDETD